MLTGGNTLIKAESILYKESGFENEEGTGASPVSGLPIPAEDFQDEKIQDE